MNDNPMKFYNEYYGDPKIRAVMDMIKERPDEMLYCTTQDVLDAMSEYRETHNVPEWDDFTERYRTAQIVSCLIAWRPTKQIYTFDEKLADMLARQDLTGDIPIDVLKRVPCKAMYLQSNYFGGFDGVFVFFSIDVNKTDQMEMRMFLIEDDTVICYPLFLIPGKTLDQCLEDTAKDTVELDENGELQDAQELLLKVRRGVTQTILQLVLYLCAENKDVIEKKRLDFTPKKQTNNKKKKRKLPPEKKIVEFEVGKIVTRSYSNEYRPSEYHEATGTGSAKRPHMRKAHWHHFWTGSRSKPEERKLILRWVPPTFVNQQEEVESSPTINKVRKKR